MEPEKAKDFIKENVHAAIAGSETIAVTSKSNGNATIDAALKRAIATFSTSGEGDFLGYLKKILLENQLLLDGSLIKVTHVKFPQQMTEKQRLRRGYRERFGFTLQTRRLFFRSFQLLIKVPKGFRRFLIFLSRQRSYLQE